MMNFIRRYFPEGLLLAASLFFLFFRLGATTLTNWDEAWHAALARDIWQHRRPFSPHYNGVAWFATAPLYPWLVAVWFGLFGMSELGVRFFSAAAGGGTIWLTYLIGRRLWTRKVGLLTAVVLLSTVQFLYRSRTGNLDLPLTFLITLAVYAWLVKKPVMAGVSTGLAVLVKGPFGLLSLPLLWVAKRKGHWRRLVLATLLVALPWHGLMSFRHGYQFIEGYFTQYIGGKLRLVNPISGTSPWWYLGALKHGLKGWSLVLLLALLVVAVRRRSEHRLIIPVVWAGVVLGATALVTTKNSWYIIPIYPAISLIIGVAADRAGSWLPARLISILIVTIALFHLTHYWESYVVPGTTEAEAALAKAAGEMAGKEDKLFLDDSYHPVAVYYSGQPVTILRFGRGDDVLNSESIRGLAKGADRLLVLTNTKTWPLLDDALGGGDARLVIAKGDKMLMEVPWPKN